MSGKAQLDFAAYRQHVMTLINAALAAADPATAVSRHLHKNGRRLHVADVTHPLDQGKLYLIGVGKASVPMAAAAAALLGDDLTAGVVITKRTTQQQAASLPDTLTRYEAAHPVSDESSIRATKAALDLLAHTTSDDLVLCLISGGTSALLTQPSMPLKHWQALNEALLASGCTINEFNCVRRQLDRVKGGGLAQAAAPARVVSLILSDVIGNPLPDIGSGPTVPADESPADARTVLARYSIGQQLNVSAWEQIMHVLRKGPNGSKRPSPHNVIVGDVRSAAEAAADAARHLGFDARLLTVRLEGEAREAGRFVAALTKDAAPGTCLLLGGETTVTLRGDGIGGRNLETALAAAIALDGWPQRAIGSVATDGDDGPTQAAGAVVTGETVENGRSQSLDPIAHLENNDSYTYFQTLDDTLPDEQKCLIKTGLTGTNVNDLIFILRY